MKESLHIIVDIFCLISRAIYRNKKSSVSYIVLILQLNMWHMTRKLCTVGVTAVGS